jgi:hypothetical protein
MRAVVAALIVCLAAPSPARAQDHRENHDYWSSIFADFFMGPQRKDEFRWHGRIAPGATLEIKGVNGRISARPSAGKEIELVAFKRGRRNDPKQVEIAFVEKDGGLTVCAVYPSRDGSKPNECQPGKAGRSSVRNNDVVVDFEVSVPAGLSFVARSVNGRIDAQGLGGDVAAYTVNGSVHVTSDGHVEAETVNGSIEAAMGKADWKEAATFKTVNGSVSLALPGGANTLLRVETVNGSIANDFPLSGPAKKTRRELSGVIGQGGRELQVRTVNGSVEIKKAS